jgi:DNA invertase Pin-like site-specific DNA recombinase
MTIAAIYVRQSRHKEGDRTTSPEVQEETCRALPAVAACDAVEVFSDLDVSGKSKRGRKAFLALMERIKTDSVSVVAVYDLSRNFRSVKDALEFRVLVNEHPKIKAEFVKGRMERGAVGGFSYTVLAAAHQMEREMVSEKRADTDARKAKRGEPRGMAPYGYRWHEGKWIVEDAEAAVVCRIFAEYANGNTSAKALADRLNAENVPRAFQARNKHKWMSDTVVDTLRRVAYVGKTYTDRDRQGELVNAQWPAIVDPSTFKRVQSLMEGRKVQARKPVPERYIFGRLLVCSRCGGIMRATRSQGHAYYHCRRDVSDRCASPAVREDVLLAWADALFARIADRIGKGLTISSATTTKRKASGSSVKSLEASLSRLELGWIRGTTSDAMYGTERTRLQQKLEQAMIEELVPSSSSESLPPDWKAMFTDWQRAGASIQRHTLNTLFEALHVEDGAVISYTPRAEQRATIERVIGQVTKGGFTYSAPLTGRGSNLTKTARTERRTARLPIQVDGIRGKGGIRTLEGALHPLPA